MTVSGLVKDYFKKNPNVELKQSYIDDVVSKLYYEKHGKTPKDVQRAVRSMHQSGFLVRVSKGIYKYDPLLESNKDLYDFTDEQKTAIFERDNYRCVICGNGKHNGHSIAADHIRAKDLQGKNTLDNGQTLCYKHNNLKKNHGQVEFGKKFFEKLMQSGDDSITAFCKDIMEVYEKHNME